MRNISLRLTGEITEPFFGFLKTLRFCLWHFLIKPQSDHERHCRTERQTECTIHHTTGPRIHGVDDKWPCSVLTHCSVHHHFWSLKAILRAEVREPKCLHRQFTSGLIRRHPRRRNIIRELSQIYQKLEHDIHHRKSLDRNHIHRRRKLLYAGFCPKGNAGQLPTGTLRWSLAPQIPTAGTSGGAGRTHFCRPETKPLKSTKNEGAGSCMAQQSSVIECSTGHTQVCKHRPVFVHTCHVSFTGVLCPAMASQRRAITQLHKEVIGLWWGADVTSTIPQSGMGSKWLLELENSDVT